MGTAFSGQISDEIIDSLLHQGGWSSTADDNCEGEKLNLDLLSQIVRAYPEDNRSIGLLSLALGAGKWGVADNDALPPDPAKDKWRGPGRSTGKHLMSYKIGGVGLPHLDVGHLADFINFLTNGHSEIGTAAEQSVMHQLARDLDSGTKYDQIKGNHVFQKWMLEGLRLRDVQVWILESWLESYWLPAYAASKNDVRLALVLARIWNTSPGLGKCAASRALAATDRIQAALQAYVDCPGGQQRYRDDRWGWMKRPVTVYDMISSS